MQKKYLLNEIKMLIEQNKELQIKINELNISIKERDSKIEEISANAVNKDEITELNNKIKRMESLIDEMTRESIDDKNKISQLLFLLEDNESQDEPHQDEQETEQKEFFQNSDESFTPIDFGEEINYASTQIGKVIVKISDFCNNMASSNNQDARELINLALGRGEVFKSDVMTVLQSNEPFSDKASIIENKIKDVESYITSLYGQM